MPSLFLVLSETCLQIVIETTLSIPPYLEYSSHTHGYVAVDGIFFDDSPQLPNCDTLPLDAAVGQPTPPPPVIKDCDFETDFCDWHAESGLNSSEQFVWDRTTGSQQDSVNGPPYNHDGKNTSMYISPLP